MQDRLVKNATTYLLEHAELLAQFGWTAPQLAGQMQVEAQIEDPLVAVASLGARIYRMAQRINRDNPTPEGDRLEIVGANLCTHIAFGLVPPPLPAYDRTPRDAL
jgi:hypothetical protein